MMGSTLNLEGVPVSGYHFPIQLGWVRKTLGYSYLADSLMNRTAPNYWRAPLQADHGKTETSQGGRLGCSLLKEFEKVAAINDLQLYVLFQYHNYETNTDKVDEALSCLNPKTTTLVDLREPLRKIAKENRALLDSYFFGGAHMTPKGNAWVADTLAKTLQLN